MSTRTDLAGTTADTAPGGRLDYRVLVTVGAVAAGITAVLYVAALATHPLIATLKGFDLQVYLQGGALARHQSGQLYSWHQAGHPGIGFTYTPFVALLFAAVGLLPFHLVLDLMAVASVAAVAVTVWIAFRELGWDGGARLGATLLITSVVFWTEPVQRAMFLGQIEPVLMVLVVWDMCQPDRRWWKGAGVGVAAGIKLVPIVFIAYLLFTRRVRAAVTGAIAFVATALIGLVALPHASSQFWAPSYFLQAGRTGFVGAIANQSLRGILTRLAGHISTGQTLWYAAAIVVGLVGLAAAVLLHRAGRTFEGLMAMALTALLTSPISWDHHWVWLAPFLAVGVNAAMRARGAARAGWLAGTVATVAVFGAWPRGGLLDGGLINYAPSESFASGDQAWYREYHWHGLQLLAGNSYILAGGALFLVVLVSVAVGWRRGQLLSR